MSYNIINNYHQYSFPKKESYLNFIQLLNYHLKQHFENLDGQDKYKALMHPISIINTLFSPLVL